MASALLGGRYRLLEPLTQSGDSRWKAELCCAIGKRPVAIRILRSDDELAHALVEGKGKARGIGVVHPGLLQPIELLAEDALLYLVSEWSEGESLADVVAIHGRLQETLPWRLVTSIGLEALRALDALARRGLAHGSVSPWNLRLGEHGEVRLAGVGIALAEPLYAAPEVAEGGQATPASDVYALARALDEALGRAGPNVPPVLAAILAQALEELPERRFPSPRAMELELARVLLQEGRSPDPRIVAAAVARTRAAREVLPEQEQPTLRFGQLDPA